MNDPSLGSRGLLRSPQSARGGDGRGRKDYEGEGLREGGREAVCGTDNSAGPQKYKRSDADRGQTD